MAATHDRAPRWSLLLQLLAERGRLSVAEVCQELGVSEATVRRDFNELAAQQLATRTHGGVLATAVAYDLPARYKTASHDLAKQQIAVAAAGLVAPGHGRRLQRGHHDQRRGPAAGHAGPRSPPADCARRSRWSPTPSTSRPRWCCARRCAASAWAGWPGPSPTSRPARSPSPPCPSSGSTCSSSASTASPRAPAPPAATTTRPASTPPWSAGPSAWWS